MQMAKVVVSPLDDPTKVAMSKFNMVQVLRKRKHASIFFMVDNFCFNRNVRQKKFIVRFKYGVERNNLFGRN